MKMFLALILMVSIVRVAQTEQIGDMNADGQVGIEEAIIALQVAAGIVPGVSLGTYIPATGNAIVSDVIKGKTFSSEAAGNGAIGTLNLSLYCDDRNVCTDDTHDPVTGCVYTNNTVTCDDLNPQTYNDTCDGAGVCDGIFYSCTPSVVCATSEPDGLGGCNETVIAGFCLIGGACYADGSRNPVNSCEICSSSQTPTSWSPVTAGVACGDAPGECVNGDTCDGAGGCTDNGFRALGTSCGDLTDNSCTNPDTCDGNGSCLLNDESAATICRASTSSCDVTEHCTGSSPDCPADVFAPAGTEACAPYVCNGIDPSCPTTCASIADCQNGYFCNEFNECVTCGTDPTPSGGECPAECTACVDGTCIIICSNSSECRDSNITCPDGFSCEVKCLENNSCDNAVINCPDAYSCNVDCDVDYSCISTTINCSASGTCNLYCGANYSCVDSVLLNCGSDTCSATCGGGCLSSPNVICGNSCDCSP